MKWRLYFKFIRNRGVFNRQMALCTTRPDAIQSCLPSFIATQMSARRCFDPTHSWLCLRELAHTQTDTHSLTHTFIAWLHKMSGFKIIWEVQTTIEAFKSSKWALQHTHTHTHTHKQAQPNLTLWRKSPCSHLKLTEGRSCSLLNEWTHLAH